MQVFKNKRDNLLIIDQKKKKTLDISQIIMLRGFVNYTCFYLQNGKQSVSARTLKHYEGLLNDKGFIRIHRGFLVNQKCILKHNVATSQLILVEGHEAEISRRRKNEYLKGLENLS
ncbi:two-component system LytT family response regulator [Arcicella aurantiaca]|uniref:Two-component system LytT family response regulator n=1 Tax=Arcicella aurantiaca TaxID=591202 RepID=A0A316E993_9BACT|nr:LytTR family DNA-binding domain-containing protein [Arcicella aurantiaca]PWK27328.1 two-component system LytT family response regulator [Arcicella aurantiaca]